jgi:hypothetical protein
MTHDIRRIPRGRNAGIALYLLLIWAFSTTLPGKVHALGGPWPVAVSVEGEVRRPGSYTLPPGSTLSALIVAAGGFTDNASLRGAILTRTSAKTAQDAELKETVTRIEAETDSPGAAREAARPVMELLASLRPSGRIPVRLSHPRLLKGSPADLPLEGGDVLRIPAKTGDVGVTGAVRPGPRVVPFTESSSWKKYVDRAGGYADGADRDHVYLLRADGTATLLSLGFVSWNATASRWEVTALSGTTPAVEAGDTVVVPRLPASGLPEAVAGKLPGILMRAAEIAGAPVTLP